MNDESLDQDLRNRDALYGKFIHTAEVAQGLKDILRAGATWDLMTPKQKEALDMIMAKAARIVNGNCRSQKDTWYDIAGYAKLGSGEFD